MLFITQCDSPAFWQTYLSDPASITMEGILIVTSYFIYLEDNVICCETMFYAIAKTMEEIYFSSATLSFLIGFFLFLGAIGKFAHYMSYLIENSLFKKDLQKPKESALTKEEGDPIDPDGPDPNNPAGAVAILGAGAAAALELEPTVRPDDRPTDEEREARARAAHWARVDR
jgi:hypothetical protein